MTTRKTSGSSKTSEKTAAPKTSAQEALELTWVLKGHLKNAQISYLRVGSMLAQVRDRQLYTALHHEDIEHYAEERLNLGRTSLYKYLKVYDWAVEFHPDWLQPKPAGFIPDLSDAADLMWIDEQLKSKDLHPATQAKLDDLRAKGLAGTLRKQDMAAFRTAARPDASELKTALAKLRNVRRSCARLKDMPAEALTKLDAAIEVVEHAMATQKAGAALPGAA